MQWIHRSNSITPKGDGNPITTYDCRRIRVFKFHYPERGRKQQGRGDRDTLFQPVQIPLPRKGTETAVDVLLAQVRPSSNSITPKGDGNTWDDVNISEQYGVQIPLPRKGTETKV